MIQPEELFTTLALRLTRCALWLPPSAILASTWDTSVIILAKESQVTLAQASRPICAI
jgi:hypothetical protein